MIEAAMQKDLVEQLSKKLGKNVAVTGYSEVGGGCINHGGKLSTTAGDFFLKWNSNSAYPGMFEAEAKGLELLDGREIKVPELMGQGSWADKAWLLLEWLEAGRRQKDFWENFGRALAALHRNTNATFGLNHDNYIGSLPQSNKAESKWSDFFMRQRLLPQIELAQQKALLPASMEKDFEQLFKRLPDIFPEEKPALLHGDLWSGNFITGPDGQAAIIDPAVYYGNREMDLAMSRLFGGFDEAFYTAYHESFPLMSGYRERVDICNLYPLMVHINLFGVTYLSGVSKILKAFA